MQLRAELDRRAKRRSEAEKDEDEDEDTRADDGKTKKKLPPADAAMLRSQTAAENLHAAFEAMKEALLVHYTPNMYGTLQLVDCIRFTWDLA